MSSPAIDFALTEADPASSPRTDHLGVLGRELMSTPAVRFPLIPLTPLGVTVSVVIGSGTEEQMLDVDARRVVTAMQHAHPIGDGPVYFCPGSSVRERCNALDDEAPIARFDPCARPHQTLALRFGSQSQSLGDRQFGQVFASQRPHDQHHMERRCAQ